MNTLSHHAVVLEGEGESGKTWAKNYIQTTLRLSLEANPDVLFLEHERFSVAEARVLKERASQTPFGNSQVFVIMSEKILREAQNALLKLLEEPAKNTYFIIIVPSVQSLLSTVRSRLIYCGRVFEELREAQFAENFIHATIGERLRMLEPLVKNKERMKARNMLDALEKSLQTQPGTKYSRALKEIAFVRDYIADTSSSLKMLFEHLALTL